MLPFLFLVKNTQKYLLTLNKLESHYRDYFCESNEYIDFTKFDTFDKAKKFF